MKTAKAFALISGLILFPAYASACLCENTDDGPEVLLSTHALVFVGQVRSSTKVDHYYQGKKGWPLVEHILAPLEVFKGNRKLKKIKMISFNSSCDEHFKIGAKYLIYAKALPDSDGFHTSTCDWSKKMPSEEADADLRWLREHAKGKKKGGA